MAGKYYAPLQKLWASVGSSGTDHGDGSHGLTQPVALPLEPIPRSAHTGGPSHDRIDASRWEAGAPIRELANTHSARIAFYGIASGEAARFFPWDVTLSESYESEWNHESVYGRNDPMSTFSGTRRNITLEFKVIAASVEEAAANMIEVSNLTSLMYPTYRTSASQSEKGGNATQIQSSPLMRVHYSNLIIDPSQIDATTGRNANAKKVGLVMAMNSLNVTPDFEAGVFNVGKKGEEGTKLFENFPTPITIKDNRMYPKLWTVALAGVVFHTFPLGFRRSGSNSYARSKKGFGMFPYGEKHVYAEDEEKTYNDTSGYDDIIKKGKALRRIIRQ